MKKALLIIFCLIAFQAFAQTTEIIATGIGANEADAKDDAFVAAIEQAIGVMVSSELIVENGEITKDWIKTRSNGFIESYSVLAIGKDANANYVTIRAVVSQAALSKELKITTGTKVDIDGSSLAANLATKQKLYDDLVEEFPVTAPALVKKLLSSCELTITGVEFDHTQKGASIPFVIEVKYNINNDAFNEALAEIDKVFTALSIERTPDCPSSLNNMEALKASRTKCNTDPTEGNMLQVSNGSIYYQYIFSDKTYALVERHFIKKLESFSKTIVLTMYEDDKVMRTQRDIIDADVIIEIIPIGIYNPYSVKTYIQSGIKESGSSYKRESMEHNITGTISQQYINKITSMEISFPTD